MAKDLHFGTTCLWNGLSADIYGDFLGAKRSWPT